MLFVQNRLKCKEKIQRVAFASSVLVLEHIEDAVPKLMTLTGNLLNS
jgi:hypothetical protein